MSVRRIGNVRSRGGSGNDRSLHQSPHPPASDPRSVPGGGHGWDIHPNGHAPRAHPVRMTTLGDLALGGWVGAPPTLQRATLRGGDADWGRPNRRYCCARSQPAGARIHQPTHGRRHGTPTCPPPWELAGRWGGGGGLGGVQDGWEGGGVARGYGGADSLDESCPRLTRLVNTVW